MSQTITTGIFPDISIEEYHGGAGLSNSGIKMLLQCPRKYQHHYLLKSEKTVSTKAMLEGNQFHTYILEPEKFTQQYFVTEKIRRAGAAWEKVEAESGGREVIFKERLIELENMKSSLMAFPRANALLSGGVAETSIYWEDADTGVLCKSRPDYMHIGKKFITDLKTTEDASYLGFSKSVAKYNYYVQAAMMIDGFKAATGEDIRGVFNFAIEKSSPYCSGVYLINDAAIEMGRQTYKKALRIFAENEGKDLWPSYSDDIQEIQLPAWVNNEE